MHLYEEDETPELLFSQGRMLRASPERKSLGRKSGCLKDVCACWVLRLCSLSLADDVPIRTWFPKENLFSFHTATTTMQA